MTAPTDGWAELTTAALVGTARRGLPDDLLGLGGLGGLGGLAERDAGAEVRLLDAAAVGAALRWAGRVPDRRPGPLPHAPADRRPPRPPLVGFLLALVLAQPPVGRRLQPVVLGVWARAAGRAGVRAHHGALVALLESATADRELRDVVRPVLDERGTWLATQNPAWRWAARDAPAPATPEVTDADWSRSPTARRVATLTTVRAVDPARGRDLLGLTWSGDAAPARADLLGALAPGLSADDEPLLEAALDDRSARVRDVARGLLDLLPGSARAARLGALLAPLVSVEGRGRRARVVVDLPGQPGPAGERDGLGRGPRGRSQRGWWLEVAVRGAPLEVWTTATGLDRAAVVGRLDEPVASTALRLTTLRRRDPDWARAHLEHAWDAALAAVLPAEERTTLAAARVRACASATELTGLLALVDGPWSETLSLDAVTRLAALPPTVADPGALTLLLATRLHPAARPALERLVGRGDALSRPLAGVVQHLALVPTIEESFQ
ncbi:hypothetical protein GCM10023340_44540 [Nocardioides marinquilinus]|uniref:HEAT repeat domain-containing protein n=1 Tax=Nocardioides marinquilinus TaxID=1210400 RepID=A0ABP9Q4G3_9ACTN